jgi:hypothetical protein
MLMFMMIDLDDDEADAGPCEIRIMILMFTTDWMFGTYRPDYILNQNATELYIYKNARWILIGFICPVKVKIPLTLSGYSSRSATIMHFDNIHISHLATRR